MRIGEIGWAGLITYTVLFVKKEQVSYEDTKSTKRADLWEGPCIWRRSGYGCAELT